MIRVVTSVWVDHLRRGDPLLVESLEHSAVALHPFVVGEIACGSLRNRKSILEMLQHLPVAAVADDNEILQFIDHHALHGQGIGYIDVHLLDSVALTQGSSIWTRDLKLRRVAGSARLFLSRTGVLRRRSRRSARPTSCSPLFATSQGCAVRPLDR